MSEEELVKRIDDLEDELWRAEERGEERAAELKKEIARLREALADLIEP